MCVSTASATAKPIAAVNSTCDHHRKEEEEEEEQQQQEQQQQANTKISKESWAGSTAKIRHATSTTQ
jgi:hypothetical protein